VLNDDTHFNCIACYFATTTACLWGDGLTVEEIALCADTIPLYAGMRSYSADANCGEVCVDNPGIRDCCFNYKITIYYSVDGSKKTAYIWRMRKRRVRGLGQSPKYKTGGFRHHFYADYHRR